MAAALSAVPRIRGGREAIDACRAATAGLGCDAALDELAATWELLEAAGAAERVVVDFSVMRSFDYYTGLVAEAYAPGLGLPLGGGGRYDGVLAAYDAPAPAAGFALGLERVMIALVEQGAAVDRSRARRGRRRGRGRRARRRAHAARGRLARRALVGVGRRARARGERLGAAEALLARVGRGAVRLDRAGEPALPLEDPVPYPPTSTWADGGDALG